MCWLKKFVFSVGRNTMIVFVLFQVCILVIYVVPVGEMKFKSLFCYENVSCKSWSLRRKFCLWNRWSLNSGRFMTDVPKVYRPNFKLDSRLDESSPEDEELSRKNTCPIATVHNTRRLLEARGRRKRRRKKQRRRWLIVGALTVVRNKVVLLILWDENISALNFRPATITAPLVSFLIQLVILLDDSVSLRLPLAETSHSKRVRMEISRRSGVALAGGHSIAPKTTSANAASASP